MVAAVSPRFQGVLLCVSPFFASCPAPAGPAAGSRSRRILSFSVTACIPPLGGLPQAMWRSWGKIGAALGDEPTPEANRYGVGSAARLKLRQQMPHVTLHSFLRQEEALADLPVDKSVGDEL